MVAYLPGLSIHRPADLNPGSGKTDARDAHVTADIARTLPHLLHSLGTADDVRATSRGMPPSRPRTRPGPCLRHPAALPLPPPQTYPRQDAPAWTPPPGHPAQTPSAWPSRSPPRWPSRR
ncbi:transposase [Streptomyces varsoviensis]|uniref:IS110 family transposase n=1 Tax=Streptomyces varsoviensis TaxID=67373 RepID=UPI0033E684A1